VRKQNLWRFLENLFFFFDWSVLEFCQETGIFSSSWPAADSSLHMFDRLGKWDQFCNVIPGDLCPDSHCKLAQTQTAEHSNSSSDSSSDSDEETPEKLSESNPPKNALIFQRGIEVGQTFYLGTKYSECFNAIVHNFLTKTTTLEMGCYGLGVSRILQAIVEKYATSSSIRWPICLAPYLFCVLPVQPAQLPDALDFVQIVRDVLPNIADRIIVDDRFKLGFGMKMKDSELIGIPFTLVIGTQWLNKDKLEFKVRTIHEEQDLALSIPEFREYLETKIKPQL